MPSNTTNYNIPYPIGTDPANISGDMGTIAQYIDTTLANYFATNVKKITATDYNALNRDFIISDSSLPTTIHLPDPQTEDGLFIRIVNYGSSLVTVQSALGVINGTTSILPLKGLMAISTGGEWWCLPLSSSPAAAGEWQRPVDWIEVPELINGEEVVYAIGRIYENSANEFIIECAGDYSVDWGDGTSSTHGSGTVARHEYDFASISSQTLTSDGLKQVLIEVRPIAPSELIEFLSNSPYYEVSVTGPMFTGFGANKDIGNTISVIIKYVNSITNGISSLFNYNVCPPIENFYADVVNATDLSNIFADAASIKKVVINSGTALTDIRGMFIYSGVANFFISDTSNVTNFSYMFDWWPGSENFIPMMDTSSGTNFSRMFAYSPNIKKIPNFDLSNAINVESMFIYCACIEEIPAFDLSNVQFASYFCESATHLRRSNVTGLKVSHSYLNCSLSSIELNNIYTNLGIAESGASITVSGNPGSDSDDPSIATAKGWTVIG